MIKTGLNRYVYRLFVDYNIFNISHIINIHKHIMKNYIKQFLNFCWKTFIELLGANTIESFSESLISNTEGLIKCISVNNWPCQTTATLVNVPFTVSANKGGGSCNTIDDPYARVCVPVKNMDVKVFGVNETRFLVKYESCEC